MAHFANVNDENIVQNVIVVADSDCAGGVFPDSELAGQVFIASIGLDGTWLQVSYNTYLEDGVSVHRLGGTPFRGKYPSIGDVYDADNDQFVTPNIEVSEEGE